MSDSESSSSTEEEILDGVSINESELSGLASSSDENPESLDILNCEEIGAITEKDLMGVMSEPESISE